MSRPLITVYIPFHTAEYAEASQVALASLEAQDYRSFETIMVCNGTPIPDWMRRENFFTNTVAAFGRRLIAGPYHTLAAAANAAISLARGEYIVRLDADDEFSPDALMEYVRTLTRYWKENEFPRDAVYWRACIAGHWAVDDPKTVYGGGLLLSVEDVRFAGGYDENKSLDDGAEIVCRMAMNSKQRGLTAENRILRTSKPVYMYHKHARSMSHA